MNIFAAALNIHDHNTYDGKFHYLAERYTRKKHNLNPENSHDTTPSRDFFYEHVLPNFQRKDSVFAFTCSNLGQQFVIDLVEEYFPDKNFLEFEPKNLWDRLHTDSYYYIDHHQSHAVYALLSSGYEQSDILAIDGRGWQYNCIFIDKHGNITNLSDKLSIGGNLFLSNSLCINNLKAGTIHSRIVVASDSGFRSRTEAPIFAVRLKQSVNEAWLCQIKPK